MLIVSMSNNKTPQHKADSASTTPLLEHDFRSEVGYWVHMTADRLERAMNAELAGQGITYRQCQVLAWLALDGELSQVELAERMNVEPPTLVKALDRMEKCGLVCRTPSAEDRRRNLIQPTRKAIPVWKKIVACIGRVRERSCSGLSPAEIRTLRTLLERVHGNLAEQPTAELPQRGEKKKPPK